MEKLKEKSAALSDKRLHTLDGLRGFAVINMIFYHAIWDMVYIFGCDWAWYKGTGAHIWQQCICMTFITLSGFCSLLGKQTLKRGLVVFGGGALVTAVTLIAMPEDRVVFGILTFMGTAMIIVAALKKVLNKIPAVVGLIVSLVMFVLSRHISKGYFGLPFLNVQLPKALYSGYISAFFGFPNEEFFSTDYFALFPWLFLFLFGLFLFRLTKDKLQDVKALKVKIPFFGFVGRHSLIIYLLHQPIIYAVLYVFFMIIR
ncbi:MAG: heparan-alpha-glucosaminide N-acetyltransferase domain-containing protein [Acutalibacteraceae bacterium]